MNPITLSFNEILYIFQITLFLYATHKYIYIFQTNQTKPILSKPLIFSSYIVVLIVTIVVESFFPALLIPPFGFFLTAITISILSYIQLGNFRQFFIATLMINITNVATGLLSYLFNTFIYSRIFTDTEYDPIAGSIIGVILFYIFALTIHRLKYTKEEMPLPRFYWVVILQTTLLSVIGLILLDFYLADTPFLILLFFGLIIIVNQGMIFYQYEKIYTMVKDKYEDQMVAQENKYYKQQLKMMDTSLEQYKALRHDFRNKLSPLYDSAIRDGRNKEIITLINELAGIHEGNILYSNSGNHVIDSIINFKLHSVEKLGFEISVGVFVPEDLKIPTFDFTSILGNILDNALEAIEKIRSSDKWLNVDIRYIRNHLLIQVSNSYDGIVKKHNGEGIVTRKKDKESHGIGLKSIQAIAQKYDGEMLISYDDKKFQVKVILFV
jgi:sensor histidine kinase YesM